MLFGYPIEAVTYNNWLHECLIEILCLLHDDIRHARRPVEWPEIIPERFREKLKSRVGLKDRLEKYSVALGTLPQARQDSVYQALVGQNQIAELLSARCDCQTISDLPLSMQSSIEDLFHFAFTLLSPLGIRDIHYETIYESSDNHVCPFCGCEFFDAPGAPREALDHYLPESRYPFAAANLYNLVPMGNKCNSRYKLAQDILWGSCNRRRKAFNPYDQTRMQISLDNSVPFAGKDNRLPNWVIDFVPDCEEVATWDDVFSIRERYTRDVLDVSFKSWLDDFGDWYCSTLASNPPDDIDELLDALERYSGYLEKQGFREGIFLKAATFRMLRKQCQLGDQRLTRLVQGVVAVRMQ